MFIPQSILRSSSLIVLIGALLLSACSKSVEPPSVGSTGSSFALLQTKVFDVSCTQCHNDISKNIYGNLSLSDTAAYKMLIGAPPTNAEATKLGMQRVTVGHPEKSFILFKLSGELDSLMGDAMPQHGQSLSPNKIEFIRQWIAAGAPKDGMVADTALLNDASSAQAALVPLTPPPAGQGFQLHLAPFPISPASEREIFSYKDANLSQVQWVKSFDIRMRQGSHHFILWTLDGAQEGVNDGDVRDRSDNEMNRQTRSYVFGAQTQDAHYTFPDGVGLPLSPGKGFDLNSHYVNTTNEPYYGEAYINVVTVPETAVQHIATPFLQGDFYSGFVIPAHGSNTRKFYWPAFTDTTHLFLLSTHTHARMTNFNVYVARKGVTTKELIYHNADWHEPATLQLDLLLMPGDRLYSETSYTNDTDHDIHFGYTSQDEMNVVLGYFWQ